MSFKNCLIVIFIVAVLYLSIMNELFRLQSKIDALDRTERIERNEQRWGMNCWSCPVKTGGKL